MDKALPFAIGISLVVAIGTLLYFASIAVGEQQAALRQQQRSYEIITLARRLDGSMAKAESSLARYVISMDKDIGRQYQDQWATAGEELQTLRRATRDDPMQQRLVRRLQTAYEERGGALSDIALRTTYDQKSASLGKFYEASQAPVLNQINALLAQVIETENDRLREHSVELARADNSIEQLGRTYRLLGLALIVALLVLAWVARSAIRERKREQRLIDDEYLRAQKLEAAVAERTAELEIAYAKLQRESADREKMERSMRQMQKMEAVGQLTGGIAHDFNNMLAVVVGGLELARRRVEGMTEVIRHIDNAMEGANRAAALTRRLLAFARSEPNLPDASSADDLIRDMIELLDRAIGDQIRIELELESGDWKIYTDTHQLENALLNLAVNARDAMEGRGTLILRTRQARLRAGEVENCAAGEYICLSVTDSGCGMAPEVLERVFEPFFTTKPVGKGTGLGLSQIFGFVRQAGGHIQMMSEPGKGTEVRLYLPRHRAGAAAFAGKEEGKGRDTSQRMPSSGADASADASLTILVVEDDPRVLAQTRSALAELGHEVICCDHPRKTEATLHDNPSVQLILSDVLMPDMTGPEMIAALPSSYRSIPVIFATGYAGEVTDNSMFEGHMLLRKPYTLNALKAMLDEVASVVDLKFV